MRYTVSLSYSNQILGKRESQTRQVFNFAGIENFCGYKISRKWPKITKIAKIAKFNTFKVRSNSIISIKLIQKRGTIVFVIHFNPNVPEHLVSLIKI